MTAKTKQPPFRLTYVHRAPPTARLSPPKTHLPMTSRAAALRAARRPLPATAVLVDVEEARLFTHRVFWRLIARRTTTKSLQLITEGGQS